MFKSPFFATQITIIASQITMFASQITTFASEFTISVGEIHFQIRYFCTTQGSSGDFASAVTWHVLDGSYHRFIDTSPID